jgi:hypothetical protein
MSGQEKKAKTPKAMVAPEAFVKAWQTSESVEQVAEATGLKVGSIRLRAAKYRKLGIELKQFERARKALDVEALKQLAAELSK